MTLVSPKAVFYHVPKTGGTWVVSVLRGLGIGFEPAPCTACAAAGHAPRPCCAHATYLRAALPSDGRRRFSFLFVRHPLRYLQSYWTFKTRGGWDRRSSFDRQFAYPTFPDFIRAVTRDAPGWVSGMFEMFAGPPDSPAVDFIGKQETLREDLLRALRLAGEEVDEWTILRAPAINKSASLPEWRERCRYTPELERLAMDAERHAIERFGYAEPVRAHSSLHPTRARSA